MSSTSASRILLSIAILYIFIRPTLAFGAGNIASVAKIEGSNWRHGDIEDTLLSLLMSKSAGGKKFDKLSIARVYFGNWLRDYSQAIDVGTVKYVSAEAIRILLWVLGFMTFGYGTKEFEVTADRLGCYRPEDHIDNPKDYADNVDATKYDPRLRGPVNERVELAIDPQTGLKNYIANERANIMTSASHVRKLFSRSIQLGRSYARNKNNKEEFYEALRLLGTGLHCLEDYSAHSNYVELSLIELGGRDIFPHVGRRTQIRLPGARNPVYPLVTGTFGGVDFLHSVLGEFNDKATQSEIQELEGTMKTGGKGDTSLLKEILGKIPKNVFGGKDAVGSANTLESNSTAARMNNVSITPRQPEEFTRQMQQICHQIYPIIEWHDDILKGITETVEKIPILPDLISTLEEQVNIFVFSLIAPIILPLITQVKNELNTGSSEIIKSSQNKQFIVFNDDNCNDPTHSMLAKDHFSNVLNEPAGKIASEVLKWVVPQLMQCWDDERVDVDRTINRILSGVFHHPAQRELGEDGAVDGRRAMFAVVEQWWSSKSNHEKNELCRKLSSEGVKNGENHEGTHDTGHGCGHPIKMKKKTGGGMVGSSAAGNAMNELNSFLPEQQSQGVSSGIERLASKAAGGGKLGSFVGAIAGGITGSFLGGTKKPDTQNHNSTHNQQSYENKHHETGSQGNQYYITESQGGGNLYKHQGQKHSSSGFQDDKHSKKNDAESGYGESHKNKHGESHGHKSGKNHRKNEDNAHQKHHHDDNRQEATYESQKDNRRQDANYSNRQEDFGRETTNYGRSEYGSNRREEPRREETASYGRSEYGSNRREEPRREETASYGRSEYDSNRREEPRREETASYGRSEYGSNRREEPRREETASYGRSEYGSNRQEIRQEYGSNRREDSGREEIANYGNQNYSRQEDTSYNQRRQGYGGYGSNESQSYDGSQKSSRGDRDYEYR
ncbi:hypothetical protein K3495_g11339 [Podosphaera aphanis]|nr:hypothetical protein K3495_g11339 [Podosphaera aphanis]